MHQLSIIYKHFLSCTGFSTDTRNIENGQMFFCLKGANFNGNKFAKAALDAGASYAIIDEKEFFTDPRMILVKDVLKTMQKLANYHRREFSIPVIGITGTNGKTTTKELIHAVLSKKYRTHATKGNFNNHIGVPMTLLSMPLDTEIAIIEMGANHIGEIEELCQIAEPNFGLITSIGKAHLEGFGSIEGVIKTKNELYQSVMKSNGLLFVNQDNNLLIELSDRSKRKTFGSKENAEIKGSFSLADSLVSVSWGKKKINTQLVGGYNFDNIMAAICMGDYFKVPANDIVSALEEYKPENQRSQLLKTSKNRIIVDAYNANPTSLDAALDSLSLTDADNKVVIIGDMLELGAESRIEHQIIMDKVLLMQLKKAIFVGSEFMSVNKNATVLSFLNTEAAHEYLHNNPIEDSLILLKGSRGIALEKLLVEL